jgi:uncharacterized membrane protein
MGGVDDAMADYKHEVAVVVNAPAELVDERLQYVESWSTFLADVEKITKVSHERYDFEINSHGHHRVCRVALRRNARDHSFSWKALKGAAYNGHLSIKPMDERQSLVTVSLVTWPDGFMPAVADMMRRRNAGIDAMHLQHMLSTAPSESGAAGEG